VNPFGSLPATAICHVHFRFIEVTKYQNPPARWIIGSCLSKLGSDDEVLVSEPAMVISMSTAQGRPDTCPICGADLKGEPSDPGRHAPCPQCGHRLWFTWDDHGDVQVVRPTGNLIPVGSLEKLAGL